MKIQLDHVNYRYNAGMENEHHALRDISLTIPEGEFIALTGSTGSGKSTLVQLLNGLKFPTSGVITYDGRNIGNDKKELCRIRRKVGLVFQYPEYQLFDETVCKDVSFGPRNAGYPAEEAMEKARGALRAVGVREELFDKSPFDLSGGEKRRVAIAGILAMEPEVLILDEPTAGLDPAGKEEILDLVHRYQEEKHTTVIMVSHNMDEVAEYAQRILVLQEGSVRMDGDPHEVFLHADKIREAGLSVPQVAELCQNIGLYGPITLQEAANAIFESQHGMK